MGPSIPWNRIRYYLEDCPVEDFLDIITYVWQGLSKQAPYMQGMSREFWHKFVSQVFHEHTLMYAMDESGGVHCVPDREFATAAAATIELLSQSRFESARFAFEHALKELRDPNLHASAIRHTFDACESVFKVIFGCTRLGESELEKTLRPCIKALDASDQAASGLMLNSFKSWVSAAHHYRHANDNAALSPPSFDLTILMISTGAGFLRWLAQFDKPRVSDRF
jgi:hypothetical protein